MPPFRLLGAQAMIYLGVGIAIDIVLVVIAVAFGVPSPVQLGGFLLSLALVAAASLGTGLLIAAAASNGSTAHHGCLRRCLRWAGNTSVPLGMTLWTRVVGCGLWVRSSLRARCSPIVISG